MMVRLPGRAWRIIYQGRRLYADGRAVLAGYCNHCPNDGTPGSGGGYLFWRCALQRHHPGMHRSRNYVWSDDGTTDYAPVPVGQPMPDQPWTELRAPSAMTRRQRRNRRAWDTQRRIERQEAKR
jgi:hypothetical protein